MGLVYGKTFFNFQHHIKTIKLLQLVSDNGVLGLIYLRNYAMQNRQDGILRNLPDTDIELICGIKPENEGKFVDALIESGYAFRWKDIEIIYREEWYTYFPFVPPDPEALVMAGWFEHLRELWKPHVDRVSERNRKNREGKNK